MGTSRVSRSERRAERTRKVAHFPQLPPAPDDYPAFPDKSTWPVVFPLEAQFIRVVAQLLPTSATTMMVRTLPVTVLHGVWL